MQRKGTEEMNGMDERTGKRKWVIAMLAAALLAGVFIAVSLYFAAPDGVYGYTVQKEQNYVEYSEEYDYWDVLTVEYPQIANIEEEVQQKVNQILYDTAMDRVAYWHLEPSDDVKAFQEEIFSVFASDVNCEVPFHSQYLVSVDFQEYYCAGHPLWCVNGTRRAVTLDLTTGESYELADLFDINEDFVRARDRSYSDDVHQEYGDEESMDFLLSMFLADNEEINQNYLCRPFFCIDEEKGFIIGFSLDPWLGMAYTMEPANRSICTRLAMEELEAFKKESDFWEKYDKSEETGEVLPCADKQENIWLGDNASVWGWDFDQYK